MARAQDYEHIFLEIGSKGHLTPAARRLSSETFRLARIRYPSARIGLMVGGYDDDPRELRDLPEVRKYIAAWARDAGLSDWRVAVQVPWDESMGSLALLQACGAFGPDSPIIVTKEIRH
jgi:hypothetical protein